MWACAGYGFVLLSSAGVTVQKTHTESTPMDRQMSRLVLQYSLSPSLIYTPPWAFAGKMWCGLLVAFLQIYFHSSILAGAAVWRRCAEAEEVLMFPCQCFSQRQRFTGSETDRVTHTHTLALRLFLISCVASAQQRKGGHDDVKMGQGKEGIRRGQEAPQASSCADTFHRTLKCQFIRTTKYFFHLRLVVSGYF